MSPWAKMGSADWKAHSCRIHSCLDSSHYDLTSTWWLTRARTPSQSSGTWTLQRHLDNTLTESSSGMRCAWRRARPVSRNPRKVILLNMRLLLLSVAVLNLINTKGKLFLSFLHLHLNSWTKWSPSVIRILPQVSVHRRSFIDGEQRHVKDTTPMVEYQHLLAYRLRLRVQTVNNCSSKLGIRNSCKPALLQHPWLLVSAAIH